jgi:MGT family glycosyltransferase
MTRFLFGTAVAAGHVTPTLPISRALVERGHQVVWITGRTFKERIEATGARFYPLPEAIDQGDMNLYEFFPELKKLHGLAQLKWYVKHAFIDTSPAQITAINAVLKEYHADVLVGDLVILGIFYISELCVIPSALISVTPLPILSRDTAPFGLGLLPGGGRLAQARNRLLNWFSDYVILRDVNIHENKMRSQIGLQPRRAPFMRSAYKYPALVMQLTTPAFEYPRRDLPANVHFTGPMLPKLDPAYSPPVWWPDLSGDRPVILVNQGTIADNPEDLVFPVIETFKNEDVLVVAVPFNVQTLGRVPKNVRAEKFIPFEHLLPHVDVMVTNGGYGGTQLALAHGIPLVVAGATEEKMEVAARVEWSGVGINLRQRHPSPSKIQEAVRQVLTTPTYRENARRIQRDFAQYNGPQRAAELLEALIT